MARHKPKKMISFPRLRNNKMLWALEDGTWTEETDILPCACPICFMPQTVTALPSRLLALQTDGTTHVCHPTLGGCNHGFAKKEN